MRGTQNDQRTASSERLCQCVSTICMQEGQKIIPTVFLVSNRLQQKKARHHCTVSAKLVVGCKEPLVAMTVTVDAVACVVA